MPRGERARRGRQGLQGRDRDAQRGAHRHRRADARPRAGRAAITPSPTRRSGSSSARRSPSSRRVQHQLARAAIDVEAATLTVYNAARLRDAGQPFLTEAAMCKIFASEVAERVASLAVNLFGGIRVRQGLPGREAVPRRQDRADLRGHVEPAAADDCEADAVLSYQLSASASAQSAFSYQNQYRTYPASSPSQYPVPVARGQWHCTPHW